MCSLLTVLYFPFSEATPTKITIPMILFILPTVILIAGGPAALNLMAAFGGR